MSQGYGARTRSQMSLTRVCAANYCQEATPPPCTDSLLHPSCKNREVSLQAGRSFARPCFHSFSALVIGATIQFG